MSPLTKIIWEVPSCKSLSDSDENVIQVRLKTLIFSTKIKSTAKAFLKGLSSHPRGWKWEEIGRSMVENFRFPINISSIDINLSLSLSLSACAQHGFNGKRGNIFQGASTRFFSSFDSSFYTLTPPDKIKHTPALKWHFCFLILCEFHPSRSLSFLSVSSSTLFSLEITPRNLQKITDKSFLVQKRETRILNRVLTAQKFKDEHCFSRTHSLI